MSSDYFFVRDDTPLDSENEHLCVCTHKVGEHELTHQGTMGKSRMLVGACRIEGCKCESYY